MVFFRLLAPPTCTAGSVISRENVFEATADDCLRKPELDGNEHQEPTAQARTQERDTQSDTGASDYDRSPSGPHTNQRHHERYRHYFQDR